MNRFGLRFIIVFSFSCTFIFASGYHHRRQEHEQKYPELHPPSSDIGNYREESARKPSNTVTDIRLPRSIKPLHYHVKLMPFINGNFSIHGYVDMLFHVLETTSNVTLHINGIITHNNTVKLNSASNLQNAAIPIKQHIYDADRQFYIIQLYNDDLKAGYQYAISLNFTGYLNDDMNGFYRSSYTDDVGQKRWIAASQFQPTDARKAFPCLDEPSLKANFTIELAREKNMTALSNMPLTETTPIDGIPGWVWDKFATSVPMSTYLVAFVISDFSFKKSDDNKTFDFKVWARKSALYQVKYALKVGPPLSKFFEEYFQISYPLPKQDMVALPDFSAGAMENWGLITYRETTMLYDPKMSTASSKMSIGSIIAHETAHQWFGNLVTPSWWTDLWLNEGFATYMQYLGLDSVEPSFKMLEQFVSGDLHTVFALDCLESSHPINVEVQHPNEISGLFDKISYAKGASIIRMMHHFLGDGTFKKGLSNYLKGKAYSSAVQDDLWQYLTEQATSDASLPQNLSVKTIMDTWTLQMGYPVITVTKNNDGTASLKQEKFILLRKENSTDKHDYKWWIPITFASKSNPDFKVTKPMAWMNAADTTKTINGVPANEWIMFNVQQTGYYIVNYDQENWNNLIEQLSTNYSVIHTVNRAQIINDAIALARAGMLPYQTAMEVVLYLKNETEMIVWKTAFSGMQYISDMLSHSGGYAAYEKFYAEMTVPLYTKLGGFADKTTDPHLTQRLRALVLQKVCDLGYRACVDEAVGLFNKWMRNPDNHAIVSPNLKYVVYCTAIKNGGYDEWKFAWERYQKADVASEKQIILQALGCTKETWIQNGYLENALTPGKGIRKQDVGTVFSGVAREDHGTIMAWEFFKNNYDRISKMFEGVSFTLGGIVNSVTFKLNTRNHLNELKEFQEKNKGKFGSAEGAVRQAVENVENNISWMDNHYNTIIQWLTNKGYGRSLI